MEPSQKTSSSEEGFAVINMAVASVFFFLMATMVKVLKGLPISQIVFFRALIALVICYVQLKILRVSPWGTHKRLLFFRGFFGTVALILFFTTLHQLPLATAVTVQYTSPIFTTLLMTVILKETFYKGQYFFFLLAFSGVVFIKGFEAAALTPLLQGILAAFFAACAYTTIRKIQQVGGEHPLVIIFYFPLVTLPIISPRVYSDWVNPTGEQWLWLLAVGVFVQIAQYFMTKAYQKGEGSVVSIVGYLGVLWATLGGYFLFNEVLPFKAMLGMMLVLGGVVGNTLYRIRQKRRLAHTIKSLS